MHGRRVIPSTVAAGPWSTAPMHVQIRPLDLASETDIAQLNALDEAMDRDRFGGSEPFTVEQRRAVLRDTPYWRMQHWVAVAEPMDGGETIVATASTHEALQENLEAIHVGIEVHPAFRGHGIATALLEQALIPAIRASGRTLVDAGAEIPAEGDPDDPALPANRLAARLGLSCKNIGVCRMLPLPLEESLLERLAAKAAEKQGAYRIERWDDGVPEEHLAAYGRLLTQLELDDPSEELEFEAPEFPAERIRVMEQRHREQGKRSILAVAIAPDGTLAGNSEVQFQEGEATTVGWQENTLVMPEHRGHRLGLALKVATHAALREQAPGLRALATWNSHVNPWMIAINEQLGYRVAFRELGLQGRPDLG